VITSGLPDPPERGIIYARFRSSSPGWLECSTSLWTFDSSGDQVGYSLRLRDIDRVAA
jgi:hypothetical protein